MKKQQIVRNIFFFAMLAVATCSFAQERSEEPIVFNRDIRPILSENCFACHGADKNAREADLRLDDRESATAKLESDQFAIIAGQPDKSGLILRILAEDPEQRMPPPETGKTLSPAQITTLRRWIQQGAQWQQHWAFIPPARVASPKVKNKKWPSGEIDRFVLARLEKEGLHPAAAADPFTLLRRLSFDLTGLPPSRAEVEAFVGDKSPQSYEAAVDRLLASPHYGERMAMHWLDLVRYADSGGYHSDVTHSISPYRDYVITAFDENMPFDQFTREQLAGDLLPNPTTDQRVATGYNRLNKTTEEGGAQPGEYLVKYAADRVRTLAGVWMGATMGCAECHDHKYDPYTMKDFYSLSAFFADVKEQGKYSGGRREPEILVPSLPQKKELKQIEQQIVDSQNRLANSESLGEAESKTIADQLAQLKEKKNTIQKQFIRTMVTVSVEPREIRILPRGDWLNHSGPVVTPALPEFLANGQPTDRRLTRMDLANWFVARDNPLTSRVFVNRLWKMYFGIGLSKRLDDVGAQGEWPTHPQLLDYLAIEFMESGWDVKRIIKLMVMSNTYRQTSVADKDLITVDPLNRLFTRQSRWRMDAEMIRDNALAISGLLVRKIGGPSVKPYQPKGYWSHLNFPTRTWKHDIGENQYRRGLYIHWQRTFLHPSMLALDAPSREECTAQRPISNTPKGALVLLNDPTYVEAARCFAARALLEGGKTEADRLAWIWSEALSRPPSEEETRLLAEFVEKSRQHYKANPKQAEQLLMVGLTPAPKELDPVELVAWTSAARALLNLNEMITRN